MPYKIAGYVTYDEKNYVNFIQLKCSECNNFEEIVPKDGNYQLKKFHSHGTGIDATPLRYICTKCNNETNWVTYQDSPLEP